jgi:hypothetical protein
LIGNDVGIIIFQEEGTLDSGKIDALGQVPQVFMVVQPVTVGKKTLYKLATATRSAVRPIGPDTPTEPMKKKQLRDFLLAKLLNNYTSAMNCPPMNRLFITPRGAALEEICVAFKPETKKERERREIQEKQHRDEERAKLASCNHTLTVKGFPLVSLFVDFETSDQRRKLDCERSLGQVGSLCCACHSRKCSKDRIRQSDS